MKKQDLEKFNSLLYFTKESLRQYEKKENNLNFNLKYWQKKGGIIPIKRGFYILKRRFVSEPDKDLYLEYLANKLYQPSYLSLEYVMNKYSLLTEAPQNITSMTIKKTKIFNNQLAVFSFYSLSQRLFLGYEIKKFSSASVMVAKKTKAVFDYLYLRFLKKRPLNKKIIEELRINWENINQKEFTEIKKYARISRSLKVMAAINLIQKIYYASNSS